ncbi:MAG: hypothetical protein AAFP19_03190 [Bacteroidota bacterium]
MIRLIASLFLLLFIGAPHLMAQPDLPSEEVEVIKDFEANLEESEKLTLDPELPALDTAGRKLTYEVPSKTIKVNYLPPKIRPIAMRGDKVDPGYKGFLKLGYGIPSSPYAEVAYNHSDPKRYDFGGHIRHHSANYNNVENQRFNETFAKLNGTYYFDEGYALTGKLGYTSDEVHFYGYDDDLDSYDREDIRQTFGTFGANVRFYNAEPTQGDINYRAEGDLYALSDNYASDELGFKLDLGVTKWFNEVHPLNVDLVTDFTRFQDTATQNLNNFALKPNFTYHADRFKVRFGGNLTSNDDNFKLFPDIEASVNIIGNKLAAYAGWNGDLYKNNFRNLSDYNPFIQSRFILENTSYNNYYGGVRGNVSFVSYQVQAGLKDADNLALFLNDPVDTIRFLTIYDNVSIFNIQGSLTATPIKDLDVTLTLGQNFYSPDNQEKAWHLPAIEFNAGLVYTALEDKLRLKADLFIENGVPILTLQGEEDRLNGLFDLSIGGHFQVTKNFGIFLDILNIASNRRQRWYRYPTYGLNILGGITARI